MKEVFYFLFFLLSGFSFSQTPTLFYEDGGDLGPIEVRDEYIYYIDQNVGLKQLSLITPEQSSLLVNTETINGIAHIFWGVDGSQVYFSNIFAWYRSSFDNNQLHEASFYRDFASQKVWDIKNYGNEYILAFSDIGTFYGILTNVDPLMASQGLGSSESFSRNIIINTTTVFASDKPIDGDNSEDHGLFRGTIDAYNDTKELLYDFEEPIHQLEIWEDFVYILLRESNSIVVFDITQETPWIPLHFISLDTSTYTIENIVIHDGDIYFTDSQQGNIFVFTEESLSVQDVLLSDLLIFPNPVEDFLRLQVGDVAIKELRILDIHGRIVSSYENDQIQEHFDMRFLSKGIYIAHFMLDDNQNVFTRFIKK